MADYKDWWGDNVSHVDDPDHVERLRNALVGRKVVAVTEDALVLDTGKVLYVRTEGGCCAWYDITNITKVDNIIMDVRIEHTEWDWDSDERPASGAAERFSIFVYADNTEVNLLAVEGNEGSGYYGRGYRIMLDTVISTGFMHRSPILTGR